MRVDPLTRRRLRLGAMVVGLALLLYPFSFGPSTYLIFRRFTPSVPFVRIYDAVYAPLWGMAQSVGLEGRLMAYEGFYAALAADHDGRDTPPLIIPPEPRDDLPE